MIIIVAWSAVEIFLARSKLDIICGHRFNFNIYDKMGTGAAINIVCKLKLSGITIAYRRRIRLSLRNNRGFRLHRESCKTR